MKKGEIIATVSQHDSTILSFPDRGPWGDARYRGNCSGWVQVFLIWKYRVRKFAELFAGSGTGSDVCRDMEVPYIGADLNPNPVRPDIMSVNAITDEVPDAFRTADMVFMHPPYGAEIGIPYAGSQWEDAGGKLAGSDLGQMPWKEFMSTLNGVIMKYYAALEKGAQMSVLMGDVRRKGHFYSMLTDIVKPGEMQQLIVKAQHNCVSNGRTYANRGFVPIEHEFLMVLKKPDGFLIGYSIPKEYSVDIRDSKTATWTDVVFAVVNGKDECTLTYLYTQIEGCGKAKANPHWKEKIRQVLNQHPALFHQKQRGVWTAAA